MAVNITTPKCPSCGADVEYNRERGFSFCSYCGTKVSFFVDGETIHRNIDEARIKEAENERILRMRELEYMEKENTRKRETMILEYGVIIALVLLGAIFYIFDKTLGGVVVLLACLIGVMVFKKNDENAKKEDGGDKHGIL